MPDMAMCQRDDCPLKETCYRYMAQPSSVQSYCRFQFYYNEGKVGCFFYIPLKDD